MGNDPGDEAPEVDQSAYAPQLYLLPEGLQGRTWYK